MYLCGECETEMKCIKTGLQVRRDNWLWAGDKFACPSCGDSVIVTAATPIMVSWEEEGR